MFLLTIFLIITTYVLWKWSVMMVEMKKLNLPGPLPMPVMGNANIFIVEAKEFLTVLSTLFRQYGNSYRVHLLSEIYVVINHPREVEALVTNANFNTKGRSYDFLRPWLGEGLLTSTGIKWKNHRKFLTPAFHFNILQNFFPIFVRNTEILTKKLHKVADGSPVDIFPVLTLAALDNVAESIMGVPVDAQKYSESKYVKYIEELSEIIAERIRNGFLAIDPIFNLTSRKKKQDIAVKYLHEYTKNVINKRRQELIESDITKLEEQTEFGTKNKYAFLDLLLLAEIDGKKLDDETVRQEVDTFMFEGHDTTSSGLVYSLYCISHHPSVQSKIYEEQKMIYGGDFTKEMKYSDLNQMKYLELVIKESLRLYPSVPLIERLVVNDAEVGNMRLLAGSSVIINIFQMQRHPELFENPLEFRPERFETEQLKSPFSWMAFSAGPRNCIGQKFAIIEMKVVISAIIRKFMLIPHEEQKEFTANLILKSPSGVHVGFKPREKQ